MSGVHLATERVKLKWPDLEAEFVHTADSFGTFLIRQPKHRLEFHIIERSDEIVDLRYLNDVRNAFDYWKRTHPSTFELYNVERLLQETNGMLSGILPIGDDIPIQLTVEELEQVKQEGEVDSSFDHLLFQEEMHDGDWQDNHRSEDALSTITESIVEQRNGGEDADGSNTPSNSEDVEEPDEVGQVVESERRSEPGGNYVRNVQRKNKNRGGRR
jgi:hypothetical protein